MIRVTHIATALVVGVLAYAPAHANVTTTTANGATTTAATNNQQTNIVTTVVSGGTSTVTIRSGVGGTGGGGGPAGGSGPVSGTVTTIQLSAPIAPTPAGQTVTIPTQGGGSITATSNGDGTFNIELPGGGTATINADGSPVEVNRLGGFDGVQSAMIEQFHFDRADGFRTSDTGASAGGVDGKLSLWVNAGYSTFDEDQTAIDSDGDTWSGAIGGDWQFSERFVAGISFAGSVSDVTTTFNQGEIETTGYTVSPYFVSILGRDANILLDGGFGYTMNDNDATRTSGTVSSSYDSSSWFVSSNVTYIFNRGNFRIQPKVGVLWLDNTTDGYTESDGTVVPGSGSKLGRLSAGARLDYTANPKFTPFVSLTGEYDFESEDYSAFTGANRPSQEDKGATLGLGFSSQLSERVTGDVSGTTALGRDDYTAYSLSGTLRFNF